MTGVMLDHSAAPMLPSTVHGHVRPISGNGCRGGGPHGSQPCQRALCVPRARRKYVERVGLSRAYVARVGRSRDHSRWGARVRRFNDVIRGSSEAETSLKPRVT
jgi:hypothetical protein